MGSRGSPQQRVEVPQCHYYLGIVLLVSCFVVLLLLNARASDFGTIASALGLYSAALLGVFSVLTAWKSAIIGRKRRYIQVEDDWSSVVDRSVKFALNGSALSFMLMLFGVIAPAIKQQLHFYLGDEIYFWAARVTSALAISGVVLLGMISLQIVRDINAVYNWNNWVEEQDEIVRMQRKGLGS